MDNSSRELDVLLEKIKILEQYKEDTEKWRSYTEQNMNDFFLVTMSVIIFLMQGGFAFLEAGSVRSKNTTNILIKNLLDAFVSGVFYWIFGYSFGYGNPGNAFIGYGNFAHYELPASSLSSWIFQYVFAATAATIVSGAVAERCDFVAYLVYSSAITVHYGGGIWGAIAVALFSNDVGILYKWDKRSGLILLWQLAGIGAIAAWTAGTCLIMFYTLKKLRLLRVPFDYEYKGLDIPKHGEPAYPYEAYGHGWGEKGDTLSSIISSTVETSTATLSTRDSRLDLYAKQIVQDSPNLRALRRVNNISGSNSSLSSLNKDHNDPNNQKLEHNTHI